MSSSTRQSSGLLELMHIIERLKTTKRAGWVRLGAQGPESIADHMYRMAMLAMLSEKDPDLDISKYLWSLAPFICIQTLRGYHRKELTYPIGATKKNNRCVMLALVHDLAEAEVGDITPHDGISREEKYRRESIAIEKFTSELLPAQSISSQRLKSLWLEYEDGQTREAQFVKDLDRFELALQGVEYEKRDKLDSIQTFFETTVPLIKHPEVKGWANELMDERASIQGSKPFVKNFKDVRPQ
ncbi:hypothetical protein PSHT_14470 [Puccinia striiformis]|uniref:5'-deoxynucleotidase n=1 Tax=Puccinia striiformis TaxID=27350 RepID=A0A2S4UK07_9BASI|nr:hypothetical protein PSHT_14470 [Puccinia striiformis]